jgi:hypothetical protein
MATRQTVSPSTGQSPQPLVEGDVDGPSAGAPGTAWLRRGIGDRYRQPAIEIKDALPDLGNFAFQSAEVAGGGSVGDPAFDFTNLSNEARDEFGQFAQAFGQAINLVFNPCQPLFAHDVLPSVLTTINPLTLRVDGTSRSRRNPRFDLGNFRAVLGGNSQIIGRLQVHPEFRPGVEISAKAQGCVRRDRRFSASQSLDARSGNPACPSNGIGRKTEGREEFLLQNFSGMNRRMRTNHYFSSLGSVAIDNFNLFGVTILPNEAEAPLIVDANAMLSGAVALKGFEAVARWLPQGVQVDGGSQHSQLALRDANEIGREALGRFAGPYGLGCLVFEIPNHRRRRAFDNRKVSCGDTNAKKKVSCSDTFRSWLFLSSGVAMFRGKTMAWS